MARKKQSAAEKREKVIDDRKKFEDLLAIARKWAKRRDRGIRENGKMLLATLPPELEKVQARCPHDAPRNELVREKQKDGIVEFRRCPYCHKRMD